MTRIFACQARNKIFALSYSSKYPRSVAATSAAKLVELVPRDITAEKLLEAALAFYGQSPALEVGTGITKQAEKKWLEFISACFAYKEKK